MFTHHHVMSCATQDVPWKDATRQLSREDSSCGTLPLGTLPWMCTFWRTALAHARCHAAVPRPGHASHPSVGATPPTPPCGHGGFRCSPNSHLQLLFGVFRIKIRFRGNFASNTRPLPCQAGQDLPPRRGGPRLPFRCGGHASHSAVGTTPPTTVAPSCVCVCVR